MHSRKFSLDAAAQLMTNKNQTEHSITVLGAGPAGTLMSILLARRGHRVSAFERLPDLRRSIGVSGRSINLALADRGIHALKQAGLFDRIAPLLVPMRGRLLHALNGTQSFLRYGARTEVVYSISRAQLTAALLDSAERDHGVNIRFRQNCISVDLKERALCLQDTASGRIYLTPLKHAIGADGAGSVLRRFLLEDTKTSASEEMLTHGYKELTISAGPNGTYRLDPNALHIWPRGEFMMIALPNTDGSFTATLFLPHDGPQSFASLATAHAVATFFHSQFPDAHSLFVDLSDQFAAHPVGSMGTVRCKRWSVADELLLIGDAAHAIVPFHGQGMNCAFEDCIELDDLLATHSWGEAATLFESRRIPNCAAIAEMALENYVEMRNTVLDPKFALRQELAHELERRHPKSFIARYSMVMFHHEISYAAALDRGRIQSEILDELTRTAMSIHDVDFRSAAALIESRLAH
jgi:kynurenine 3-monooxygenase